MDLTHRNASHLNLDISSYLEHLILEYLIPSLSTFSRCCDLFPTAVHLTHRCASHPTTVFHFCGASHCACPDCRSSHSNTARHFIPIRNTSHPTVMHLLPCVTSHPTAGNLRYIIHLRSAVLSFRDCTYNPSYPTA